ncbi:helix-turn-helix domain-containing protein [Cellulomonas aerilata]|uniref:helix-turn-helix domain-containing protein n=1 Tax=Cellulomonas aerilata TaxID=515326 RepID=UPI001C9A019D|nr:helix-turn-helix transcriptional regulator [Cellulomonas aerilata]
MDNRSDIRDFLATRRARLTPEQVGLAAGGTRRRVPGLRREEVAVLAGVSTEWYARLEKGHISGVSDDVLQAVCVALRLSDDERTYLLDLARAARPGDRAPRRRRAVDVPPPVQWMLDAMTMSAAFVSNGRLDVVASNPLARALYAGAFAGAGAGPRGQVNLARFAFLDPAAHSFYEDWDTAADTTAALLRAEAGRDPDDRALRELVGDLSTLSPEFRTRWAAHDVRIRHGGVKRFRHLDVGPLELTYQSLALPVGAHEHALAVYTAEPGTTSEDRLRLLASLAATASPTAAVPPASTPG